MDAMEALFSSRSIRKYSAVGIVEVIASAEGQN